LLHIQRHPCPGVHTGVALRPTWGPHGPCREGEDGTHEHVLTLPPQVLYYNGKVYWVNSLGGRVSLVQNPPVKGTASLQIYDVRPSDTGLYICEVTNPGDWSGSGQGLINFTVLMPPSTPECRLSGSTLTGSDVILMCHSSGGTPTPIYTWSHGTNADPLPVDNAVAGSMILRNLSAALSGVYTCSANNELGQSVNILLIKHCTG
uniref:Ig-like domain-containing protein n=1 Tax=Denticeps clupeoides TaxID=299321 RepID=A0AAY4ANA3_9TELE